MYNIALKMICIWIESGCTKRVEIFTMFGTEQYMLNDVSTASEAE
jgi:hypothetical protein